MTQKEYKEKIEKLLKELETVKEELSEERAKNLNYEEALQRYYYLNEELMREKTSNELNNRTIKEQADIIEKYKKILDKFTINY